MKILGNINSGYNNSISGSTKSSVLSGERNTITGGTHNAITGGWNNHVNGYYSSIIGGHHNITNGGQSAVIGGNSNNSGYYSVVAGGGSNTSNNASFIGGGFNNLANSTSSIIGSTLSIASGTTSAISGGQHNMVEGNYSFIGGGWYNTVNGHRSVVLGGQYITGSTDDTVFVPNLNIGIIGSGTSVNNLGIDINGFVVSGVTGSSGGTQTLADTLNYGNITNGNDIMLSTGDTISGVNTGHLIDLNINELFEAAPSVFIPVMGSFFGNFVSSAVTESFGIMNSTIPAGIVGPNPYNIIQLLSDDIQIVKYASGYTGSYLGIGNNGVITTLTGTSSTYRIGGLYYINISNISYDTSGETLTIVVGNYYYGDITNDYSANFSCYFEDSESTQYITTVSKLADTVYQIEIPRNEFAYANQNVKIVADGGASTYDRCSVNVFLDIDYTGNTFDGYITPYNSISSYEFVSQNLPINSFRTPYSINAQGSFSSYTRSGETCFASYDEISVSHIISDADKFPTVHIVEGMRKYNQPPTTIYDASTYFIYSLVDLSSFGFSSNFQFKTEITTSFNLL